MIQTIVVGVDGSADAQRALAWAIELSQALGSRIVAVHAMGLLERLGAIPVPSGTHRSEIEATFTNEWCAPLADAGVATERVCTDGVPTTVLLATADDQHADLIVLGVRGMGRSTAQLLGSTSHQVAQRSACPVVIVPPPRSG